MKKIVMIFLSFAIIAATSTAGFAQTGDKIFESGKTIRVASGEETVTINFTPIPGYKTPASRTITVSANTSSTVTAVYTREPVDFNGDGKGDILYRDAATGQLYIWLMDGEKVLERGFLDDEPGPVSAVEITRMADFDNDGKTDILLRKKSTGALTIWFMDGVAVRHIRETSDGHGLGWDVAGISDFNMDGSGDILWRNMNTGATEIWFMDADKKIGGGVTTGSTRDTISGGSYNATTGWHIAGIGDFNGDGYPDILWRKANTEGSLAGQTSIWLMNGTNKTGGGLTRSESGVALSGGVYTADTGWHISGLGDFDGDGMADILWRKVNRTGDHAGALSIWLMNGVMRKSGGSGFTTNAAGDILSPGPYNLGAGWQVAGIGDFDNDGKYDILLRYAPTGHTSIMFMDGATVTKRAYTTLTPGSYDATWLPGEGWHIAPMKR